MKKLICLLLLLLFLTSTVLQAQEKTGKFSVNGYLTTLQNATFDSLSGPVSYDNIIHNRLNFKLYPTRSITISAEVRNRLFTGDMARAGSFYSSMTGSDNGCFDLS